jgi:murein DD-endopeptidase MepM/ murein hydrolase activator NlpD
VPSRLVEQAPSTAPTAPSASPDPVAPALPPDPRWRFFEADRTRYASPWFPGRHRVMIGYGCTEAPYYVPDARCAGGGFHHGIDVAIPCGTPLHSAVEGRVVTPAPGTVGPAYGERPLLLRADVGGRPADILLGHARRLLVQPGDRVSPGDRVALNGASAGPDGCHLHLEVRAPGGDVTTARDPGPVLRLRRPGRPQTASIGG